MAVGAGVNDGGKVHGKIVAVADVIQWKGKGNLQRVLGCSDILTVTPRLAINRDGAPANFRTKMICRPGQTRRFRRRAWNKRNAFPAGDRDFVNPCLFSIRYARQQILPAGIGIGNISAVFHEFLRIRAASFISIVEMELAFSHTLT